MRRKTGEHSTGDADGRAIDVDRLRQLGTAIEYPAGAIVYWEGEHSDAGYLVMSGRVKLTMAAGPGNELTVGLLQAGDVFGEGEALDGSPRAATATTVETSSLLRLRASVFTRLVDESPDFRHHVLHALAEDVRQTQRQLAARCSKTTVARVAEQLIELSEADGGAASTVRITQSDLSGFVGATRESTARALGRLRRAGCIRTGRGWVRIVDRDALAHVDDVTPPAARR